MVEVLYNLNLSLNKNNILVLFCDIQEKYIEKMYNYKQLLASVEYFAQFCTISNMNTYVSEQNPKIFGSTCKEIVDNLESPMIIEKYEFAMLSDSQINNEFKDIQSFILLGIEAHICIFQTAMKLLYHKKRVIIIKDCTSSTTKNERELALNTLEKIGVVMISLQCLIMLLIEDSKNPIFKKALPIIKALINLNNELV